MKQRTHAFSVLAQPGAVATPVDDAESVARRLDDGYTRIDEGMAAGEDVDAWEEFWIRLLHEYEEICDDLAEAA